MSSVDDHYIAKALNTLRETDFSDKSNYEKNKKFIEGVLSSVGPLKNEPLAKHIMELVKPAMDNLKQVHEDHLETKKQKPGIKKLFNAVVIGVQHVFHGKVKFEELHSKMMGVAKQHHIIGMGALETEKRYGVTPAQRFREQVHKAHDLVGKGAAKPGARVLDDEAWLEAKPLTIKRGDQQFNLRVHTTFLQKYITPWQRSHQDTLSFEEYVNQEMAKLDDAKFAQQIAAWKNVEYYDRSELDSLQTRFNDQGQACTNSPHLNAWAEQFPKGRSGSSPAISYRQFLQSRKDMAVDQKTLVPMKQQDYMFVMNTKGELFMQLKQSQVTHHSSLGHGQPVLAAGMINLNEQGKINSIAPFTGHYKSVTQQMINILEQLKSQGVDINSIEVVNVCKRGEAEEFLKLEKDKLLNELKQHSEPAYQLAIKKNWSHARINEFLNQEIPGRNVAAKSPADH